MSIRRFSLIDRVITELDRSVKTLRGPLLAGRPSPATRFSDELVEAERKKSANLLRVDHAGEVCAQALYRGHALAAKSPEIRAHMEEAAREEQNHLVWCEDRLKELQDHSSYFGACWYWGSFLIGFCAARHSEACGLGFVAETERQVAEHLEKHLQQLPVADHKSRAILAAMMEDERQHGRQAEMLGALVFPSWIRHGMRWTAKIMTTVAYQC